MKDQEGMYIQSSQLHLFSLYSHSQVVTISFTEFSDYHRLQNEVLISIFFYAFYSKMLQIQVIRTKSICLWDIFITKHVSEFT